MSESANTLPPEWKECAADTVRALAVARHLATRHATEETPESVLLPALLLSVTMTRASAAICNRIEGVYDALDGLREPMLIERLAGIENELYGIRNSACDTWDATMLSPGKGRGDGRK
ncbi:hypothetical protein [Sulfuritalea sp.]|uniref:hypothetical protein n=1 Tax=Sulfuritalea sp. TaxID=2480090 RepID=UPI00286E871E|nr:hypothetical protein [Sulfuritalea sp.]